VKHKALSILFLVALFTVPIRCYADTTATSEVATKALSMSPSEFCSKHYAQQIPFSAEDWHPKKTANISMLRDLLESGVLLGKSKEYMDNCVEVDRPGGTSVSYRMHGWVRCANQPITSLQIIFKQNKVARYRAVYLEDGLGPETEATIWTQ
jgi:hypothetical protein